MFTGMGDKIGRKKASKLIGRVKDSKIAEGKKKLNKLQLKGNTHRLPQADSQPVPEQWPPGKRKLSPPSCSTPAFTAEHVVIWSRLSLWSVQVGCPAVSLPNHQPTPWWSRRTQAVKLRKHWLAIAKTLLGYQHCFSHKF